MYPENNNTPGTPIPPINPLQQPQITPQPVPASNTIGILAIVFSIFLPLIGLILAIMSLKKANSSNNLKTLGIIGAALSSVFLLLSLLIFPVLITTTYSGMQKKAREQAQSAQEAIDTRDKIVKEISASDDTAPAKVEGATSLESACYTVTVPAYHDGEPDGNCYAAIGYGPSAASVMYIRPYTAYETEEAAMKLIKSNGPITKQETTTLGGKPAVRVDHVQYGSPQITFMVKAEYKVGGKTIPGFSVRIPYGDDYDQKKNAQVIIDNWQWK